MSFQDKTQHQIGQIDKEVSSLDTVEIFCKLLSTCARDQQLPSYVESANT